MRKLKAAGEASGIAENQGRAAAGAAGAAGAGAGKARGVVARPGSIIDVTV